MQYKIRPLPFRPSPPTVGMSSAVRSRSAEPGAAMGAIPNIFVICGPSGCGKSTIISRLISDYPGRFGFSVSHTTRAPRPGEIPGVHYNFTDREKMESGIRSGNFLEHAEVHGNHYGTSYTAVDAVAETGKICILDIDVQGVESIKESDRIPDDKTVFLMIIPPSIEALESRLRGRLTETEETIHRRVERGREEMKYANRQDFWDQIVVNDDIEECYLEIKKLLLVKFHLTPTHHPLTAAKAPRASTPPENVSK